MMSSVSVKPFVEAVRDRNIRLKSLSSEGKKILGYFCTYTPIEVVHASGFIPIRVMGETGQVEKANSLTPTFICPYMRLALEKGMNGEYDYLSGLIQGYTCDVTCGLMNIWKENIGGEIYHTIPLPYLDNPDSSELFRAVILELKEKLDSIGGHFTEESLGESLKLYGEIRSLVLDLYDMRYEGKLPLTARELLSIVQAGFAVPPEEYLEMLKEVTRTLKGEEPKVTEGIPVLISGSLIEDPRVLDIIEESGGKVVADDLCTGLRNFQPPDGDGESPLEHLMNRHIHRFPCPARTRAIDRVPLIMDLIKRSGTKGVIFLFQKFCTPHLADHPILSEELKKEEIPSILIEMEETGITEGQMRTRIEGFLEMLR